MGAKIESKSSAEKSHQFTIRELSPARITKSSPEISAGTSHRPENKGQTFQTSLSTPANRLPEPLGQNFKTKWLRGRATSRKKRAQTNSFKKAWRRPQMSCIWGKRPIRTRWIQMITYTTLIFSRRISEGPFLLHMMRKLRKRNRPASHDQSHPFQASLKASY